MDWVERFWQKVDRSGDCWLWTAGRTPEGYGKFWLGGKTVLAHRVAYTLEHGPIPDRLHLDHLCRVRHCVNPAHMEPVTHRENVLRGEGVAAKAARMTHCKHGHEFTPDNIRQSTNGVRRCKTCKREASRAERARKKATNV